MGKHTITTEEAMQFIGEQRIIVASGQTWNTEKLKRLVYLVGTQSWVLEIDGEEVRHSHQPFHTVEAFNEA